MGEEEEGATKGAAGKLPVPFSRDRDLLTTATHSFLLPATLTPADRYLPTLWLSCTQSSSETSQGRCVWAAGQEGTTPPAQGNCAPLTPTPLASCGHLFSPSLQEPWYFCCFAESWIPLGRPALGP